MCWELSMLLAVCEVINGSVINVHGAFCFNMAIMPLIWKTIRTGYLEIGQSKGYPCLGQ